MAAKGQWKEGGRLKEGRGRVLGKGDRREKEARFGLCWRKKEREGGRRRREVTWRGTWGGSLLAERGRRGAPVRRGFSPRTVGSAQAKIRPGRWQEKK